MFHGPSDTTQVYRYGGTTYQGNQSFIGYSRPDSSTYSLWTYDYKTQGFPWSQYDISQPWIANHGAAAEAIDQSLGFYLNGQTDWGTSTKTLNILNSTDLYKPLPGMLVINFTDHTSNNISTSKLRGDAPRVGGGMEYFPDVGAMGILVALGGQINNGTPWANATKGELVSWLGLAESDIRANEQNSLILLPLMFGISTLILKSLPATATGTSKLRLGKFHLHELISALSRSRHLIIRATIYTSVSVSNNEIFTKVLTVVQLYGGIDPTLHHNGYDDVYVLSIPSFTWTPIFTDGASPRWGHNCHIAGNRQMITVGGNISNTGTCDWEVKGVAVLDMSNVTWGSVFLSNQSAYQIPQALLSVTGGNKMGGGTVKEPSKGWTDPGLKTVFATARKTTTVTPPPINSNVAKKSSIAGPVAGGVAGGVLVLALLVGIFFFLRRRRNRKNAPNELHSDSMPLGENRGFGASGREKDSQYELQAVNERDPVELPGPEAQELNAPRDFVEADSNNTATQAAELSGTSIAPGGTAGVPHVRTPGDDLPETPFYTPGLIRRSSAGLNPPQEITNTAQGEPPNITGPPKAIAKHDPK